VYGTQAVPVENFHIPAVIFGGGVEQKQDERLVSQLDIPPTLLSLAGISAEHPMVGFDLTKEVPVNKQRALMQRGKTFAWMDANREVIVFEPQDEPKSYQYEKATQELTPIKVNSDKLSTANAYALWGSFAYKNGLYAQKDQY
jgi:phosphoglycerol transferase MdoB-like AlkP superfamily enzyme